MRKNAHKPNKLAARILNLFIPAHIGQTGLDDYEELYNLILKEKGALRANVWYFRQILKSIKAFIVQSMTWHLSMFVNYLKVALRIVKRNRTYSLISTVSLTVGMAVFLLIMLYNRYELSYEDYHKQADRIYRIGVDLKGLYVQADTPSILAPTILDEIPEVASAVRLKRRGNIVVSVDNKRFFENNLFASDPELFDILTFRLIQGDKKYLLQNPDSIVISDKIASKYYGNENPVGKTLLLNNTSIYRISGVFQDLPMNSHLRMDLIIPHSNLVLNWRTSDVYTYCMLNKNADPHAAEMKINALIEKRIKPVLGETGLNNFLLQSLKSIHLNSDLMNEISLNSRMTYLYVLSVVAFIILTISCVNYVNLAIGRSAARIREVGLREVLGANRKQIFMQFFSESIILSIIAMVLTIGILKVLLPGFNAFAGTAISFGFSNISHIFIVILLTVSVCILGGGYPAVYMSAFRKSIIQRNALKTRTANTFVRNALVVFQFTISIALIISISIIKSQMNFIKNKNMGFKKDGIVITRLYGREARQNYNVIKSELLKNPEIMYVSRSTTLPVNLIHATRMTKPADAPNPDERPLFYRIGVDYDFLKVYDIQLVSGRNFSEDFPSDLNGAFLFNETAVKMLGWEDPVGKTYEWNRKDLPVVGVMKDMNVHSLRTKIKPLHLYFPPDYGSYLSVRINDPSNLETITYIEDVMKTHMPDFPFDYRYLSDLIDNQYRLEKKIERVSGISAVIAISIACIGLLGLSMFTVEQRMKEIGIRKVLGASIPDIMLLLSKDHAKWILLANLFAWPAGYFAMNKWLESFAYKVEPGLLPYAAAGLSALIIALVTTGFLTGKAVSTNPVETIRHE